MYFYQHNFNLKVVAAAKPLEAFPLATAAAAETAEAAAKDVTEDISSSSDSFVVLQS